MSELRSMKIITKHIKQARRRGSSDYVIAKELHVDQREIKRLLTKGYYPGEKVSARLGLPVKCHACKRRMPKQKQQKQASALLPHELWWRGLSPAARQEIIKSMYQTAGAY